MASANVNGRLRMRTGTEQGETSAIKANQGQAAHGIGPSHFPRRLYGAREPRQASPLRSDRYSEALRKRAGLTRLPLRCCHASQ
jgi:hypothetical protein